MAFYSYGYGIASKSGKTVDIWTASFAMIISCILMTHMQLAISIRSFSWWLSAWWIFSLLETVILGIIPVEYLTGIYLWRTQFGDIMTDQGCKFFMIIFVSATLICLPMYTWKCIKMLVLYP